MQFDKKSYPAYADKTARKSPILKNCCFAFLVGGVICTGAEGLSHLYPYLGATTEQTKVMVPCTLILIAAILTGVGIFDKIAKFAGAGTLVPITGFANAVVAPAIDTTAEGLILGLGAKIFTIAGPVILYGTLASSVYGIVYYLVKLIMA